MASIDPTPKTQNGNGNAMPAGKASLPAFYGFLQQALTLGARKVRPSALPQLIGFLVYVALAALFGISLLWSRPKVMAAANRDADAGGRHGHFASIEYTYEGSPRSATAAAFSFSIRSGFVIPFTLNFPQGEYFGLHWILTSAGKNWAAGDAVPPEDEARYLAQIRSFVPKSNPVVLEYAGEALRTFNRQAYLAAAVMLGAASEAAIYDLSDAVVIALVPGKQRNMLEDFDKKRKLHSMLALIALVLQHGSVQAEFKSAQLHLASLFDSIRVQRNEAVHPETGTVSLESLRTAFDAFPRAYQLADRLTDWLKGRANTLS